MAKYVNSDGLTYYNNKIKALLNGKSNTNHTHNYAGSSSAGGSAKSVANSLSIQLNGGTATTFNGSAAKSINITASSVGAAASSHSHSSFVICGNNTINSTTNDTTANWKKYNESVHWYSTAGLLHDQKSQYGFLINLANGNDVHQFWATQTTGNIYHRGGNGDGWSGSWRKVIDSANIANGTTVGNINSFSTDWSLIPNLNVLAYWDGSHSVSKDDSSVHYSSLKYCIKGAFGNVITRDVVSNVYTPSPLSSFTSVWANVPNVNLLAYWNGRWDANNSNLAYCNKGAFGTGATKNISTGTGAPPTTGVANGDIYIQYA